MRGRFDRKAARLGLVALVVLVIGLLFGGSLTYAKLPGWLDSDRLYPAFFYKDLFQSAECVAGWMVPPAPYFFPDMFLLFPLLFLTGDIGCAYALYAPCFAGLLLLICMGIGRSTTAPLGRVALSVSATMLLLITLMQDQDYAPVLSLVLGPAYHGGAIVSGCLLLWLFTVVVRRGPSVLGLGAMFVVATLAIMSDLLILPQFLAPLLVCSVVLWVSRTVRPWLFWSMAALAAGAYLAAMGLLSVLETHGIARPPLRSGGFGFEQVAASLAGFLSQMRLLAGQHAELAIAFVTWLVSAVVLLVRAQWGRTIGNGGDKKTRHATLLTLLVFPFPCVVLSVLATVTHGYWQRLEDARLVLPLFVLPFLFLGMFLARAAGRAGDRLRFLAVCITVCAACVRILPRLGHEATTEWHAPYPESVRYLDATCTAGGARSGYANYWRAKQLTALSQAGLHVNQLDDDLNLHRWINNLSWYYQLDDQGNVVLSDSTFIVTTGLDTAKVGRRFGPPSRRCRGPGIEVWFYDRPQHVAFRNFLYIPVLHELDILSRSAGVSPGCLARYKTNGTAWNADGNITIPTWGSLTVRFDPPAGGDVLEVSADNNDLYQVGIYRGKRLVHTVLIERMEGFSGLQARYFRLPDGVAGTPVDRLLIRPREGDGRYSVGHVFIYDDQRGPSLAAPTTGDSAETTHARAAREERLFVTAPDGGRQYGRSDRATITRHPNGDTPNLLVALQQVEISPAR